MAINREVREKARHKTKAVDSVLANQPDEPVHSYSEDTKTLWRSGVVVRNDKNIGHDAMQRARELLNSVNGVALSRPKTLVGANDDWFKENYQGVERMIGERISIQTPQARCDENERMQSLMNYGYSVSELSIDESGSIKQTNVDFEHYHPEIDDDEPDYVPKSERES